ncbi:MAG TPA: hypothetical protein VLG47_05280 [Candidatus Saccharimonadales bacterium]|nr:hypothetical protein [Candidatus Saccharimonadales bacterium]
MPTIQRQHKQIKHRKKLSFALAFDVFLIAVVAIIFTAGSKTFAATHNITGGTNGSSCNSGGYFTPSSLTVNSGDTVTISVPSNDPYAGGLQVHGFPEGNFTIPRGGQHTTQTLTSNVSYYGTWPSTGCTKGSGTITVTQPSSPPPPTPPPSPSPSPSSHPSPSPTPTPSPSTGSSSSGTTTKHSSTTPPPAAASKTTAQNSTSTSGSTETTSTDSAAATQSTPATSDTMKKVSSTRKTIGLASIVLAAGVAGWCIWQFVIRPKKL